MKLTEKLIMFEILKGENLIILPTLDKEKYSLIYIDPPFNTGKTQKRGDIKYADQFDDLPSYLKPRLELAYSLLTRNGSLFLHLDYREVHYCKILCDQIFGRSSFINEIIW